MKALLVKLVQNLEEQTANIRSMEQLAAQKEQEHLHSKTAQSKKVSESQMQCSAVSRELDLMKTFVKSQKEQIHQLQELLADREQQHRKDIEGLVSPYSSEIQGIIHQKYPAH